MKLIKPEQLKIGDTIGILSVSGYVKDQTQLQFSKQYLESLGYKVKISDTSFSQYKYFCADDEKRAKALNDFFSDNEIKAIICARGGYGAIRILDKIDYELIKKNPKIFCGYSDISAILWSIYKNTGLMTFHGAHAISTFQQKNLTQNSFWENMQRTLKQIKAENSNLYCKGRAKGAFVGGNLCTLSSMCGSDFVLDEDFILFLEDLNEPAYKIDRMVTQLLNTSGFKKHFKGVVLGEFTQVDNENYLKDFWQETAKTLKIPMCDGFLISHNDEHLVTPYGIQAEFCADDATIHFDL